MRRYLAIIIISAWAPIASAHDGYENECCDHRHCAPYPAHDVRRDGADWILKDGRRIPAASTRHSSRIGKRGFHLCDWNSGDTIPGHYERSTLVHPKGKPVCFYTPDAEF